MNKKGRRPDRRNVDGAERLPYFTRRGALRQEPKRLKVAASRVFSSFLVETPFFTRRRSTLARRFPVFGASVRDAPPRRDGFDAKTSASRNRRPALRKCRTT